MVRDTCFFQRKATLIALPLLLSETLDLQRLRTTTLILEANIKHKHACKTINKNN